MILLQWRSTSVRDKRLTRYWYTCLRSYGGVVGQWSVGRGESYQMGVADATRSAEANAGGVNQKNVFFLLLDFFMIFVHFMVWFKNF